MLTRRSIFPRVIGFLLSLLIPVSLFSAETEDSGVIILSSDPNADNPQGFNNAVILPIPGGGTVMALRSEQTGEPSYSFSLENASLVALLNILAQSMLPPVEITPSPYEQVDYADSGLNAPTVSVRTAIAYVLEVSFEVSNASLLDTIDQAAIASDCNIYLDGQTIVVDRC